MQRHYYVDSSIVMNQVLKYTAFRGTVVAVLFVFLLKGAQLIARYGMHTSRLPNRSNYVYSAEAKTEVKDDYSSMLCKVQEQN